MRSHHLRSAGGGSSLPIEESGLDIYLDPNNSSSYSGSGTTWTNLSTSGNFGNANLVSSSTTGAFSGMNAYTSSGSPKYFTQLRAYLPVHNGGTARNLYYPLTYSVWVYPTVLSSYQTIIDQGNDNFFFGFSGNYLITYDPTHDGITSGISTNTWYNFTVTHTLGQNFKFYQDGVLKNTYTNTQTSWTSSFTDFSFGSGGESSLSNVVNNNEVFSGRVGAIMIYNRPLTATEVTSNYNALKSTYGHS